MCRYKAIKVFCFLVVLILFVPSKRLASIRFITAIVPYLILFLLLLIL